MENVSYIKKVPLALSLRRSPSEIWTCTSIVAVCIYIYTHVCMYVCMYVYVYMQVWVLVSWLQGLLPSLFACKGLFKTWQKLSAPQSPDP